jgi:hypothetical protein
MYAAFGGIGSPMTERPDLLCLRVAWVGLGRGEWNRQVRQGMEKEFSTAAVLDQSREMLSGSWVPFKKAD